MLRYRNVVETTTEVVKLDWGRNVDDNLTTLALHCRKYASGFEWLMNLLPT